MKHVSIAIISVFTALATWLFAIVALVSVWALLSSCGTIEIPKSEVKQAEEPENSAEEPAGEPSEPDVSVSVDVDIQVTVNVKGEMDADPIFITKLHPWGQAVDACPEGYILATRSEAIELVDSGYLDDFMGDTAGVWTATEDASLEGLAWVVTLNHHFAAPKSLDFNALCMAY